MARVLVTRLLPDGGTAPLIAAGHEVITNDSDTALSHSALCDAAREFDALVTLLTDRIDSEVLEAGANGGRLRVVANVAVGYDNIDLAAATRLGIAVTNTPGVLDETTADTSMMLILSASRLASEAEADLRSGAWTESGGWGINQYLGHDVHGATLGLVGYGRIGRSVARRAVGFGMNVIHHTPSDTGEAGWTEDLDVLLAASDVVSIHVPLKDSTRHLIDRARLAKMKSSAVLVNTSRGPVVDEAALADALHAGELFAAGIDVYENEPIVHPRLLSAPRTVLLPHIGSGSIATRTRMATLACEGAVAVLAGERPNNLVVSG